MMSFVELILPSLFVNSAVVASAKVARFIRICHCTALILLFLTILEYLGPASIRILDGPRQEFDSLLWSQDLLQFVLSLS
jgi:hypothetical protein